MTEDNMDYCDDCGKEHLAMVKKLQAQVSSLIRLLNDQEDRREQDVLYAHLDCCGEEIDYLWDEFAMMDDDKLHQSSIKLKHNVLAKFALREELDEALAEARAAREELRLERTVGAERNCSTCIREDDDCCENECAVAGKDGIVYTMWKQITAEDYFDAIMRARSAEAALEEIEQDFADSEKEFEEAAKKLEQKIRTSDYIQPINPTRTVTTTTGTFLPATITESSSKIDKLQERIASQANHIKQLEGIITRRNTENAELRKTLNSPEGLAKHWVSEFVRVAEDKADAVEELEVSRRHIEALEQAIKSIGDGCCEVCVWFEVAGCGERCERCETSGYSGWSLEGWAKEE